jgi:PAS domain S-box-containing protein
MNILTPSLLLCKQGFIIPEFQVSVKEVLDNALNGLETANFEFSLFTKTDQQVYILLNATPRRDVSGAVVGMIGVGQDITEQKQAAMEKTRVAHEMKTFIDTANAPIFGVDCQGLVTEWNNKAAEITLFSREEVLGKDLVKVYISAEYRESVQLVLSNALQGQVVANFEFPLYTKDNRRVEVILNATPRTDVSGRIVGVLGVGQDITERKQVEKEKTRIAAELLTLIDSVNAPIFGVDVFGHVNEWNNKSAAITGFAREEVVGKNFVEVL